MPRTAWKRSHTFDKAQLQQTPNKLESGCRFSDGLRSRSHWSIVSPIMVLRNYHHPHDSRPTTAKDSTGVGTGCVLV